MRNVFYYKRSQKSIVFVWLVLITVVINSSFALANDTGANPVTISSKDDIRAMKAAIKTPGPFLDAYIALKNDLDSRMSGPFDVPVPKDPGGGYTHEQHKRNYKLINDAGRVYQIGGEKKYADYAKKLLLAYADLYPKLERHPVIRSKSPGRLFWQSLNEAVWLVHSIQGYAGIIDTLSVNEKETIENQVFLKVADFLSEGQPYVFNRIHNHGTWATAAVGMTGYVLKRSDLVEKSLLGLDLSGKGGFIKQLDMLFSPDGYFKEGPYYQRYALMPFILFAKTIEVNEPQRKIFEYRDGILKKAAYSAIELSYGGKLFPINDAIKDKGIDTNELIYAVEIIYGLTADPQLLDIAVYQNRILLIGDGLKVASALAQGLRKPFNYPTKLYLDGPKGKDGALGVLRSGPENGHSAVLAKYTSQGLGHGHFDKLGWSFYDNNHEIITDYGAARFLNIATKSGGGYLKENNTWAKQTIAHNTLVVDEQSHFNGSTKTGNKFSPEIIGFENAKNLKIVSGKIDTAYEDISFTRTLALLDHASFEHSVVVDLLNVSGSSKHQYDLPLYYEGHIVDLDFPVLMNQESMTTLGKKAGYQHLWNRGEAKPDRDVSRITWLKENRFYTYTTLTNKNTDVFFVELGANDPNFNLRKESGIVLRVKDAKDHSFVSLIEPHGEYNGRDEYVKNVKSQFSNIEKVSDKDMDLIVITTVKGDKFALAISYDDRSNIEHNISYNNKSYRWSGFAKLFEL